MSAESDSGSLLKRIRQSSIGPIARRYFVSNGFDGALTGVGITVGAYLSGIEDGLTVVSLGLGAAVGLLTSGVWSVWEIERAEMRAEIQETEDAMLADLSDTRVERERMSNQVVNALMSGLVANGLPPSEGYVQGVFHGLRACASSISIMPE